MNEEQTTERTPEQKIFLRYDDLGRYIKEASEEREHIRDSELIPMMLEDGTMFEVDGRYLRFEFSESVKFDHKAARANGDISDEVWDKYTSVEITRKLMTRTVKDDSAKQAEEQLLEKLMNVTRDHRKK
jgi:hypothetical protein